MKKTIKIIILILFSLGCKSQPIEGFYLNESWLPKHSMCFATRIHIRNDSTFEYFYQGDLFKDHEIGKYKRADKHIFLYYNKKENIIFGYDTIKQKLDFNPPIYITTVKPIVFDPGFRDNFPSELLITRKGLIIIQDQRMHIKPSDKKVKLKKVPERKWTNNNATFLELKR